MFFIRLAGCNVGKYTDNNGFDRAPSTPFQILHPEYSTCTSFSGEQFTCDTDYRVTDKRSFELLLVEIQDSGAKHVNLTGGEPLIHKSLPLFAEFLLRHNFEIHLETSGTLTIPHHDDDYFPAFVTCSPKRGFLKENVQHINQFKFLVRGPADEQAIHEFLRANEVPRSMDIYIQAVDEFILPASRDRNNPDDVLANRLTYEQQYFALECVKRNPQWKLSVQLHKVLGVR